MAELKKGALPQNPIDVMNLINTGATIVNAGFPFIKDLFSKIGELVKTIQTDKLSTPHGKRLAIEELQHQVEILAAQNQLQKKWNGALIALLKENGIEVVETEE